MCVCVCVGVGVHTRYDSLQTRGHSEIKYMFRESECHKSNVAHFLSSRHYPTLTHYNGNNA